MTSEKSRILEIEARLQAIKEIASNACHGVKDYENIVEFCDEIYNIVNEEREVEEEKLLAEIKMLAEIKDFCADNKCEDCPLNSSDGCRLTSSPYRWNLDNVTLKEVVHTICREEVLQIIDRYKVESED